MHRHREINTRERLVHHVQELERLDALKTLAVAHLKDAFDLAAAQGYDRATLKVVLKLRKMTPGQRRERRALEAIYLAALGMLEGDPLPDEARRRLDGQDRKDDEGGAAPPPDGGDPEHHDSPETSGASPSPAPEAVQPPLILKDPDEARAEGTAAAAAGKRIYDNPYAAGDPCRAAWDEGWCGQQKSNGMETPAAYQRRSTKAPDPAEKRDKDGDGAEKGGA